MKNQPNNDEILSLFSKKPKKLSESQNKSEPSKVTSLYELKKLVDRLKPGAVEESKSIIIDAKSLSLPKDDQYKEGPVVIPQSGGQSTLRKTLLDGFEMIKNHNVYFKASVASLDLDDEYGGYPPAIAPNPENYDTWVDRFIRNNLGGRREGLFIVWDFPDGTWKLDPWTCELEKVDVA
jgi:hypothetical protein